MTLADWPGWSRTSTTTSPSRSQRMVLSVMFCLLRSDALDDGGDAHPAADAECGQAVAAAGTFQLVDQGAEDHPASGTEGVAHGDGAAVDVDLVEGQAEVLDEAEDDRGEGLVDLDEVEFVGADAGLGQRLAAGGGGAGEHDGGVGAGDGGGQDAGPGAE